MPTRKNRIPSKCRDWEKERRNRFNDACSQLGELVKEYVIDDMKDCKNGNIAKVDIILRAISYIKQLLQQKGELNAKLLATNTELENFKNRCQNKKDASTQVNKQTRRKIRDSTIKQIVWRNMEKNKTVVPCSSGKTLVKLAPKSNTLDNKVTKQAVVVLPATPYLPKSIVLPPAPQTFLLLESNTTSRNAIPIMPRIISEITKTTMVNNLPIAAYSFPLSVVKGKKTKCIDRSKERTTMKPVQTSKVLKKSKNPKSTATGKKLSNNNEAISKVEAHCVKDTPEKEEKQNKSIVNQSANEILTEESKNVSVNESCNEKIVTNNSDPEILSVNVTESKVLQTDNKESTKYESVVDSLCPPPTSGLCNVSNKVAIIKESTESAKKIIQDKIPPLLNSSVCDNIVDAGNARLELAEEFLAASPTAAFLMTFPLVSGLRADSPPDDEANTLQTNAASRLAMTHNTLQKRDQASTGIPQIDTFYGKSNDVRKDEKVINTTTALSHDYNKGKQTDKRSSKTTNFNQPFTMTSSNSVTESSFLNLHLPPVLTTTSAPLDNTFSLDFDSSYSKNVYSNHSYVSSNNLIFKNEALNSVKNNNLNIYSNNTLPTSHDFNTFGLYPCAVEKYPNKANKSEYNNYNTEENFMKVGSTRTTYDLAPQKPYEFTTNTSGVSNLNKENIFSPVTTISCTVYNPFNPDFHMPLVTSSASNALAKKVTKSTTFYSDTITNLYSQPSTLWPEEFNIYGNNTMNIPKASTKQPNCAPYGNQMTNNTKLTSTGNIIDNKSHLHQSYAPKSSMLEINQLVQDKNAKKSQSKSHINWMTSELRPLQNNTFDFHHPENKDLAKIQITSSSSALGHLDYNMIKKQDYIEPNLFPMPNLSSHSNQDDMQLWPQTRPLGISESCLDPPPISLPTLVGDLALGPHERRKSVDRANRGNVQTELSNCNNFLSVSQLMNRSTDNMQASRFHGIVNETQKPIVQKHDHLFTFSNIANDKHLVGHIDTNNMQPCYFFNDSKPVNSAGNDPSQNKSKSHKILERNKSYKNNYSTEALLKGPNNTHKSTDSITPIKFSNHKYPECNLHDNQMAHVSHFPSIADYPDNNYSTHSYSGANLYNSTTNTASNSFYSNFMSGGGTIMSTNYNTSNFPGDFIENTPSSDCNFTYPRFDNFKIKNPPDVSAETKFSAHVHKTTQKQSTGKHKADYSKKEQSKKYQSKRSKMSNETEEWSEAPDTSHLSKNKKYASIIPEDMSFSNYLINQGGIHSHHVPDLLNSQPGSSSIGAIASASGRSLNCCPTNGTRTNFNLSTIFPEIAKVNT